MQRGVIQHSWGTASQSPVLRQRSTIRGGGGVLDRDDDSATAKPAKSLAAQAPQGFGAARPRRCTGSAVHSTRRTCKRDRSRLHNTPCVIFAGRSEPVRFRTRQDSRVNHRQLVKAVARRFPDLTQRQIEDVLDVLVEVWRSELVQPGGEVVIRDFGKLTVEVQRMRNGGVIQAQMRTQMGSSAPERLIRLYFRFRATPSLRNEIKSPYRVKTQLLA